MTKVLEGQRKRAVRTPSISYVCEVCKSTFTHWASKPHRYCSRACFFTGRKREFVDRFWAKIERRSISECWPWTAGHISFGYGMVFDPDCGRNRPSHQVAWELYYGEQFPSWLQGNHHCDNPPCCNPTHVYAGTALENMADAVTRGRLRPVNGERSNLSKLSAAQVTEIRLALSEGVLTRREIAERFSVTKACIGSIENRQSWAHL